jgi:hypothetical protein
MKIAIVAALALFLAAGANAQVGTYSGKPVTMTVTGVTHKIQGQFSTIAVTAKAGPVTLKMTCTQIVETDGSIRVPCPELEAGQTYTGDRHNLLGKVLFAFRTPTKYGFEVPYELESESL